MDVKRSRGHSLLCCGHVKDSRGFGRGKAAFEQVPTILSTLGHAGVPAGRFGQTGESKFYSPVGCDIRCELWKWTLSWFVASEVLNWKATLHHKHRRGPAICTSVFSVSWKRFKVLRTVSPNL